MLMLSSITVLLVLGHAIRAALRFWRSIPSTEDFGMPH
jgi:hypothetical protein